MFLNCGVGEDSWESLGLQGDQTRKPNRKLTLNIYWKEWNWSSNTLATWCEEQTYLKRVILGKIEGRRREGWQWMRWLNSIPQTQWTWVWENSRRQWMTGEAGMLQSIESVVPSNRLSLHHSHFPPAFKSFPAAVSFLMSQFFTSDGQSTGALASASVPPLNIQGWFPLGLTGLISLLSKELSRVFSNTTVQKHLFFGYQSSLWSESHICIWLLQKPKLWLDGPLSAKWCLCFLMCCLGLS